PWCSALAPPVGGRHTRGAGCVLRQDGIGGLRRTCWVTTSASVSRSRSHAVHVIQESRESQRSQWWAEVCRGLQAASKRSLRSAQKSACPCSDEVYAVQWDCKNGAIYGSVLQRRERGQLPRWGRGEAGPCPPWCASGTYCAQGREGKCA